MSDRFDHTLERKLESKPEDAGDGVVNVRRIELITGTGRRRRWSSHDKVRIVVESFEPGANVSEVARRNGVSPQQLFAWRREARALFDESAGEPATTTADQLTPAPTPRQRSGRPQPPVATTDAAPAFASVVIAAATGPSSPPPPPGTSGLGTIEIAIGDTVVRVVGQVETSVLVHVLRAVRRSS